VRIPTTAGRRALGACGVAGLTVGLLAGCGGTNAKPFPASTPQQVPLGIAAALLQPVKIGLVVTSSSAPGQGQDDLGLAAGARVAEYRLGLAAQGKVTLDVVDDHGTAAGSRAAVQQLLGDGVAGIVYASEGSHLDAGVALAQAASTAVLLPYATTVPAGSGVWLTGPSAQQVVSALSTALGAQHLVSPLVLRTTSVTGLDQIASDPTVKTIDEGANLTAQVAADLTKLGTAAGPDAVVVWGSAQAEADAVAAVQQSGSTVPVLLGPSALSPTFASELAQLGSQGQATTGGTYVTAGVPATDNSTTGETTAFLAADRLAAADTAAVPSLLTATSFSASGAATADTRAHDAVLALVDAVAVARRTAPGSVLGALRTISSTPSSLGLAGPTLDFAQGPDALSASGVEALQSTDQGSGQRSGVEQTLPALTWFALGSAG
jgi:branched-chain amino acid transport system substrate-binding protein